MFNVYFIHETSYTLHSHKIKGNATLKRGNKNITLKKVEHV